MITEKQKDNYIDDLCEAFLKTEEGKKIMFVLNELNSNNKKNKESAR